MRYKKQILEAFDRIGFTPRDKQVEHIDRICIAFLDEQIKNVILSAPTGTGKSIIGAVVAEVLHSIKYPSKEEGASFLLTATNVLAHQYHDTFVDDDAPFDEKFYIVKGAVNYVCNALSSADEPQTAENCAIRIFQKTGMGDMIEKYCDHCEYKFSRTMKAKARHLITNYAYYFLDRLFSTYPMEKRTLCVFDEAHLINDLFTEQKSVYFSEKRIDAFAKEISENLQLGNSEVFRDLKIIKDHLAAGKIKDQNYRRYLDLLVKCYNIVHIQADKEAEKNIRSYSTYLRLSKLAKKYHNLTCAIDDLNLFEYPHVFEYKSKDPKKGQPDHEVSVKPIFVGEMFEALDNADHNLLMSATVSEQYVKRTMSLPGTTKHIRLEPTFKPASKKVIFFKPQALNYNSMKDPQTIKKICATCFQIVNHHTERGERGIILAPSFNIVQSVAETLRQMNGDYRVFEHVRGEKLADWLEEFKMYKGSAVLLTPSGFEGVDLPGDMSRYQIIVKMPFASLGDKRIKTILENYPDIYGLTALMKVVQGAGRSVRSSSDFATTYVLDTAAQRSFMASTNEWKDEFAVSFTSELSSSDS